MMRIETQQYRTEDKLDIIIIVGFYVDFLNKIKWEVEDIKYKTSRQRKFRYYSQEYIDDYEYRNISFERRNEWMLKKYIEFVGKDKIKEAFEYAYNAIKPNFEKIFGDI